MSIKYSMILLLTFFLLNCRNKKVEIVERQKAIKKERAELSTKLDSMTMLLIDAMFKQSPDTTILSDSMHRLDKKYSALGKEYDSLEFELKKY